MELYKVVNTVIASYLKSYGDTYKLDDLKKEIISKGYTEGEFNEALEIFRSKKPKPVPEKKEPEKKVSSGKVTPLPTQKFIGKKKHFSWIKFLLILFGIFLGLFFLIVLFNYMDMTFFGWNIFDYFDGA